MNKRYVMLAFVLIAIVASIYYFEQGKVGHDYEISNDSNLNAAFDETASNDFLPAQQYTPNPNPSLSGYPKVPELEGITGYINAVPFSLADLRGKVVLVDFWTYSCINCVRTQPYLNAWHERYYGDGLVIVGVHTPEFEFEENYENVKNAVEEAGIKYPVVQDNNYGTWRAFSNRFWPHKYLVDIDGIIRYDHIGEGAYDATEQVIQQLLMERGKKLGLDMQMPNETSQVVVPDTDFSQINSPEMYFGYGFDRGHIGNKEGLVPEQVVSYSLPEVADYNRFYMEGKWLSKPDYLELAEGTGAIVLPYSPNGSSTSYQALTM